MIALCTLVGMLQACSQLYFLDPDGLSYLDLSDMVLSPHPWKVINGYWSPALPILLAVGRSLLRPSRFWEVPMFHVVLAVVYLVALFLFTLFQREVRRTFVSSEVNEAGIKYRAWIILVYTIFLWTQVGLIGVGWTTPDTLITCVVLAAALCSLRRNRTGQWKYAILLPLVLASGYWVKAALLPIGIVWLIVAVASSRAACRLRVAGISGLLFISLAGPLVALISFHVRALSIGQTGALNYSWCVNGVHRYTHWQGDALDKALHPTHLVLSTPAMYSFAAPIGGSYPPWFEPSYWYAGLKPKWNFRQQIRALANAFLNLGITLFGWRSSRFLMMVLGTTILLSRRIGWASLWRVYPVWLPCVLAILLYTLVVLLPRYVAPFLLVFIVVSAATVEFGEEKSERLIELVVVLGCTLILGGLCLRVVRQDVILFATKKGVSTSLRPDWAIAQFLRNEGIPEHADVGSVGYDFSPYWARMAGVRVAAEVPYPARFAMRKDTWIPTGLINDGSEAMVQKVFRQLDICAVVARKTAIGGHLAAYDWVQVPGADAVVWINHQPCGRTAR